MHNTGPIIKLDSTLGTHIQIFLLLEKKSTQIKCPTALGHEILFLHVIPIKEFKDQRFNDVLCKLSKPGIFQYKLFQTINCDLLGGPEIRQQLSILLLLLVEKQNRKCQYSEGQVLFHETCLNKPYLYICAGVQHKMCLLFTVKM